MRRDNQQKYFNRALEGIIAVALVLVFFFVLIMVFNAFFPEGSGLQFIFNDRDSNLSPKRLEQAELQAARGDNADILIDDESWAATLVQVRNSVKSKKSDAIAWQSARKGMQLFNMDAVQTLDESSAIIRFDRENFIDLGDNSLIVIRRMEKDLLFKEKRSFMVVVDGELRGRIGGGDDSGVYLEVETPNAIARLQANPEDTGGIEFKIDVLDNDASSVTIYSGEGEVEAQGETVLLNRNQITRIEGEAAPTRPVTLAEPPHSLSPAPMATFPYRSLPPRVKFNWRPQSAAEGYHLLLATDDDFTEIVIDKKVVQPKFLHGNLREGNYYWKVSSLNPAGEGAFGPTRQFSLKKDQLPPALEVHFPAETITEADIEILGITEPGAFVYISGIAIGLNPDGTFRHKLPLKRGMNVVVVEAVDPAGNISYRSQLINRKY